METCPLSFDKQNSRHRRPRRLPLIEELFAVETTTNNATFAKSTMIRKPSRSSRFGCSEEQALAKKLASFGNNGFGRIPSSMASSMVQFLYYPLAMKRKIMLFVLQEHLFRRPSLAFFKWLVLPEYKHVFDPSTVQPECIQKVAHKKEYCFCDMFSSSTVFNDTVLSLLLRKPADVDAKERRADLWKIILHSRPKTWINLWRSSEVPWCESDQTSRPQGRNLSKHVCEQVSNQRLHNILFLLRLGARTCSCLKTFFCQDFVSHEDRKHLVLAGFDFAKILVETPNWVLQTLSRRQLEELIVLYIQASFSTEKYLDETTRFYIFSLLFLLPFDPFAPLFYQFPRLEFNALHETWNRVYSPAEEKDYAHLHPLCPPGRFSFLSLLQCPSLILLRVLLFKHPKELHTGLTFEINNPHSNSTSPFQRNAYTKFNISYRVPRSSPGNSLRQDISPESQVKKSFFSLWNLDTELVKTQDSCRLVSEILACAAQPSVAEDFSFLVHGLRVAQTFLQKDVWMRQNIWTMPKFNIDVCRKIKTCMNCGEKKLRECKCGWANALDRFPVVENIWIGREDEKVVLQTSTYNTMGNLPNNKKLVVSFVPLNLQLAKYDSYMAHEHNRHTIFSLCNLFSRFGWFEKN